MPGINGPACSLSWIFLVVRHTAHNTSGIKAPDRHFGVDRQACRLAGFAHVQQQTHHVVRDRRDRQAFHRALQAQLQVLPARELGQQLLVLHFGGDVHPGAQQGAGPAHPLGQRRQALRRGRHGGHGGRKPPLHELADGLRAWNGSFAQLGDALGHQGIVGPRGGKSVGVFRGDPLHARGQRHQRVEQGLVRRALVLQPRGDIGELALAFSQEACELLGHRQATQAP